jgi:prepilin-type N-terminal cleavage/methylation domain-containing protein
MRRVSSKRALLRLVGPNRGFTLIELLMVIAVAGVLAAAVLTMFLTTLDTFATQEIRIQNQDQARLAMDQLTRYIRIATSSAMNTTTLSDAVVTAQPNEIVFFADINGDDHPEKVRYYVSATILRMQTSAPQFSGTTWSYPAYPNNGIVVAGVKAGTTVFKYFKYDAAADPPLVDVGNPTDAATLRAITTVDLNLEITMTPQWTSPAPVKIATSVQIRQRYPWGL